MGVLNSVIDFIPNVMKRSMHFGHQLGDVVLPRLLQKVGAPPVVAELAALPFTAVGAGAALWVGGTNLITPALGVIVAGIFNPAALVIFAPMALVFAAVTCVGIGMGDAVLKKFGKTPVFDGVYDNVNYRIQRKAKLNDKAAKAKAAAELEQQNALAAQNQPPVAAKDHSVIQPFAGYQPGSEAAAVPPQPQASVAGVRNGDTAASFNGSSAVPKFAGFPPTAADTPSTDTQQGPRERPVRPERPDKP